MGDALQAQGVTFDVLHRVIKDFGEAGVPLQGDLLVRWVLHWARNPQQVDFSKDGPQVKELLGRELHRCTFSGLARCREATPEAFDSFVSPSGLMELMELSRGKESIFKVRCRTCQKDFSAQVQLDVNSCKRRVDAGHASDTFISNAGNTCC